MKYKYATQGRPANSPGRGRKSDPSCWITGPDPLRREQYYAFLKHRSQAQYRGEDYSLTWELWEQLWKDRWERRGKLADNFVMGRVDWGQGWHLDNVEIMTRREHFGIRKVYNAQRRV
jgi:hypothetical protein